MTPEISEFSYGFALTNEIVGWAPLAAAPLFPSLIEEGKAGGGYDVKLDQPGLAIYLQFKRSHCMVRPNAREISEYGLPLAIPFYRFAITEAKKSNQHEMLLALDEDEDLVFYAAPQFHLLDEINHAWSQNRVADRSIFLRPGDIGSLDDESHHVAFDGARAWLCSEPKKIDFVGAREVAQTIVTMLSDDVRPLRTKLTEMSSRQKSAVARARDRIEERESQSGYLTYVTEIHDSVVSRDGVPLRSSRRRDSLPVQNLVPYWCLADHRAAFPHHW